MGARVGVRTAMVVAIVGVVLLVGMIARELFSHPAGVAVAGSHDDEPTSAPSASASAPPAPTARVAATITHAPAPPPPVAAPAPSASSSAGPALDAASQLATVIADPRANKPQNVVADGPKHAATFSYEVVAPFRSMSLTKDTANANAWRLEGMNGPSLSELGATKQAAVQTDAQGNEFATWYLIDSGPLAPAYAAKVGPQVRVVSRAYLEANKGDYPPSFTQVLEH